MKTAVKHLFGAGLAISMLSNLVGFANPASPDSTALKDYDQLVKVKVMTQASTIHTTVGSPFQITLMQPVSYMGDELPQGTVLSGTIEKVKLAKRFARPPQFHVNFTRMTVPGELKTAAKMVSQPSQNNMANTNSMAMTTPNTTPNTMPIEEMTTEEMAMAAVSPATPSDTVFETSLVRKGFPSNHIVFQRDSRKSVKGLAVRHIAIEIPTQIASTAISLGTGLGYLGMLPIDTAFEAIAGAAQEVMIKDDPTDTRSTGRKAVVGAFRGATNIPTAVNALQKAQNIDYTPGDEVMVRFNREFWETAFSRLEAPAPITTSASAE